MSRVDERRRGTSRLIRQGTDDGSFDRDFWQAVPPAARLEHAWQMVQEFEAWRGDGGQPRLQRSVSAFNAAGVRYLLVGGYAVAFHAEPRFTKDLDLWIEVSPSNAERAHAALRAFGAPIADTTAGDLGTPEQVLQIGVPPNRVDIVTSVDGVTFAAAWPNRVETEYGGERIWVISREDLIANKRASGRPQDGVDVALLERHRQA